MGPGVSPLRAELSEGLSREWDSLADSLNASPFLRPGWILAWWSAFGSGRLSLVQSRRGSSLEGLLPVARHLGATRSPTNWHTPEFGPLCAEDGADALLAQLFSRRSRTVELGWVTAGSAVLNWLERAATDAGYAVSLRARERSPIVHLDGDWQAYERSLSGNLRRDLGRRRRRLEELGEVTLDVRSSPEGLEEAFSLEALGWKGSRQTAMSSRPHTARFYREIARWATERGWLRLIFLRVGGRPLAFHFALETAETYYALKGGFDPSFSPYSPGALMIHATLERAFREGLRRYELLGNSDWYKRRWTADAREKLLFQAFAPTPLGGLNRTAEEFGRPLTKALLKRVEHAWQTASSRARGPSPVRSAPR